MTCPLPAALAEIAEVIGLGAALRLAEEFGGGEIYVPQRLTNDHPVVRAIGRDAAAALAKYLGSATSGGRLEVPKADTVTRARRNRAIIQAVEDGTASKQHLARQHGLTTRWVRKICNGLDDGQPSLFDPPVK